MSAKIGTYLANRFHWEFSSSATVLTKGQSCWMFLSTARHQGRARPSDVEILHLRHVQSCKAPRLISWLPHHLPMCESGLSSNDSAFWTSMPLRCKLINCMWNYWLHNYRNSKQFFGANIEHMKFSFLLQRDAPPQQLQLVVCRILLQCTTSTFRFSMTWMRFSSCKRYSWPAGLLNRESINWGRSGM